MKIDEIIHNLAALNGAETSAPKKKPAAKKKPAIVAAADPKAKIVAAFTETHDDLLEITAARIVAAVGGEQKGITVAQLVAAVREYERPFTGRIQ